MKNDNKSKVTITDVAQLAGVSIKTVSRVINAEPNVRPETLAKVNRAIKALSYRPSVSARSLAGNRSFLLGLLYDNPSASYVTKVQNGVLEVCREQNYELLIHPCDVNDPNLGKEIAVHITNTGIDGLILTPPLTDSKGLLRALKRADVPFVKISPESPDSNGGSISTNDHDICGEMVAYLAELGHRDIGFVMGHPDHGAIRNRYAGFLAGMKKAGLKVQKSLCVQGFNSFESGEACARKLLNRKHRPSVIFASNDDMAAGVMKVAHEMGIGIPEDLSVAGFDDIPLASQVWPSLTTIHQPMRAMGSLAAELLIQQVRGRATTESKRRVDCHIVARDSTGPAPK